MNAKRIMHLSGNVYRPLPDQHHTFRIWEELAKGAERYDVVASAGRLVYSHTRVGNIHLYLLPTFGGRMWSYFVSSWLLLPLICRLKPDRIIAQCPVHGGFAAAIACRFSRIRLLTEIHGSHYFFPVRSGWKGRLENFAYRWLSVPAFMASDRIRSLSDDMVSWLDKVYGRKVGRKAVVVPNRVDLGIFSPAKNSYSISGNPKFVSVGSFVDRKDHLRLIEALFSTIPGASLVLVGSGPLADEYRALAADLGAAERLKLIRAAEHSDVARILSEADIYVHSSKSEGVPRAVLEAMAMGLPVVSTPVGFIEGILTHNHDVLLVDETCPGSMSQVLKLLAESECERERLGRAARQTIENRFEWNFVFDQYRRLINAVD